MSTVIGERARRNPDTAHALRAQRQLLDAAGNPILNAFVRDGEQTRHSSPAQASRSSGSGRLARCSGAATVDEVADIRDRPRSIDVLLAVEQLVGPVPLVVSGGFMPPSILAVILCCTSLAEQLGRVGCLAVRPGGALMPGRGALTLASALGALVPVGHSSEISCVSRARAVDPTQACRRRQIPAVTSGEVLTN
jgi:hypothetical protein